VLLVSVSLDSAVLIHDFDSAELQGSILGFAFKTRWSPFPRARHFDGSTHELGWKLFLMVWKIYFKKFNCLLLPLVTEFSALSVGMALYSRVLTADVFARDSSSSPRLSCRQCRSPRAGCTLRFPCDRATGFSLRSLLQFAPDSPTAANLGPSVLAPIRMAAIFRAMGVNLNPVRFVASVAAHGFNDLGSACPGSGEPHAVDCRMLPSRIVSSVPI
jgi:hypothetical protein